MDYGDWLEGDCLDGGLSSALPDLPESYPAELEVMVAQILVDGYWRWLAGSTAKQRACNLGRIQYLATRFGLEVNRYLVPADMGAKFLSNEDRAAYDVAASGRDFEAHLFQPSMITQLPGGRKDWSEVLKGFNPVAAIFQLYNWRNQYR